MAWLTAWNGRTKSILAFSFLSAYILSFLFEGQVLHRLLDFHQGDASGYIILAIGAHFLGLFTRGLFTRSAKRAWSVMLGGMGVSLLAMFPFFFSPSFLWSVGLILGGYASGATLAAWGFFLKAFTPNEERLKTCADVLILSNLIMVTINVCTAYWSPFLGLVMIMLCLLVAMVGI